MAVIVPGALSSIQVYNGFESEKEKGYAVFYYRLPGLDGRSLDSDFSIEGAANLISEFVDLHQDKPVRLFGHSLGAATVLRVAEISDHPDLRVAAASTPSQFPRNFSHSLASLGDLAFIAWRAGSLDREDIWLAYYPILLFGRNWESIEGNRELAQEIYQRERPYIIVPNSQIGTSHSRTLRYWKVQDPLLLSRHKTKFFHGAEDPVFPVSSSRAVSEIIGGDLMIIPGQGHLPHVSVPGFYSLVLEFFEGE